MTDMSEGGLLSTGAEGTSQDSCVFLEADFKGPQCCLLFQHGLVKKGDLEFWGSPGPLLNGKYDTQEDRGLRTLAGQPLAPF